MVVKSWWKQLHWYEYTAELLGTTFMLFVGLSAFIFDFGEGLPMERLVPNESLRLLITGLIFAGSGSLVAISPLGKRSGGHINPSVSLGFWIHGKMDSHDFGGYIIGQFLGALIGAVLLVLVWGDYAASVNNGMTLPGDGYSLWDVFLVEVGMTCLLVFSIFVFVSSHRLMRWTPLMTWLLMTVLVWWGAPISGTSVNPARSIGPALVSWNWQVQWLYCIAPILGALIAAGIYRFLSINRCRLLTGKIFHVSHYPCIFKEVYVSHHKN